MQIVSEWIPKIHPMIVHFQTTLLLIVEVAAVDLVSSMQAIDNSKLVDIANTIQQKLQAVIEKI